MLYKNVNKISRVTVKGDQSFDTTSKCAFKGTILVDRRPLRCGKKPALSVGRHGKFSHETQSKCDFPGFGGSQPLPCKPVEPTPSTIDLRVNNK